MTEARQLRPALHGHFNVDGTCSIGGGMAARRETGRYAFKGDFSAAGLIVNAVVDAPWFYEETALEVEICLLHPDYDCPDEDDAARGNCKPVKRIVRCPRWTPVVRDIVDGAFIIEIWRAPLAPADGSKAVGETVLADVGFSVIAMVPT
jgi:hypothetical protein